MHLDRDPVTKHTTIVTDALDDMALRKDRVVSGNIGYGHLDVITRLCVANSLPEAFATIRENWDLEVVLPAGAEMPVEIPSAKIFGNASQKALSFGNSGITVTDSLRRATTD